MSSTQRKWATSLSKLSNVAMGITAQVPQTKGVWLHGQGAWMVWLSPCRRLPRIDLHRRFTCACQDQPDSGESCTVLESGPICSLVVKLPFVTCIMWNSCCKLRKLWTRLHSGVCKTLMPDVMVPEAHQHYRSYVRELRGSALDSLHKNLAWWVVTHRNSKNHKTVKIGG